jgi:hypothetical protein|tara:strand:- start:966 stop:1796 length:831 start_codon:yes stop_codon:yes gene_type:complete
LKIKNIAILGSSGFLGSNLEIALINGGFNVLSISSKKDSQSIFWDYEGRPPKEALECDLIIDCARSLNPYKNLKKSKILSSNIPKEGKYLFISSSAVNKRSKNDIFFKGDDYIREKKKITRIIKKKENCFAIFPDIILGEYGNWTTLISEIKTKKRVYLPFSGNKLANTIEIKSLCNQIVNGIQTLKIFGNGFSIKHKPIPWKSLINRDICNLNSTNLYFDNVIKNSFIYLLNSHLIPDYINYSAMLLLRKKQSSSVVKGEDFIPSGMTRFYMSLE